jgi:hypothetical protein
MTEVTADNVRDIQKDLDEKEERPRVGVSAVMLNGTRYETVTETWMALADRVQFEKKFGKNVAELSRWEALFEDGKLKPDADLSGLSDEYLAFFAWRVLHRESDAPDYDQFIDSISSLDLDFDVDPT